MPSPATSTNVVPLRRGAGAKSGAPRGAIATLMTPDDILIDLDVPTKNRVLEELARFVGARHRLDDGKVYASLAGREEIGSTGLGCGVAIPHARIKALFRPIAAFARMKIPVPFDAPDGKPVSDMLILLVPQHATDAHLLLLAEVAEMFCDKSFREGLRACQDAAAIHAALAQWRPA